MRSLFCKWWKVGLSAVFGIVVFMLCFFPLRALMNYHEQSHLFRWTGVYFRHQLSSWDGLLEYLASFVTQFFYVGWLGALVVALLAVAAQMLVWLLMRALRLRRSWLYPFSFVPVLFILYGMLIPQHYRDSAAFREIVEYDFLMRTHQWQRLAEMSERQPPQTEQGIRATNHALAMQGRLLDELFFYQQTSPKGLLADDQQQEPLSYYSLSDIYLRLGFINEAERLAFNAKQYLPDHHKSGRAFRRLAETNIINGNYTIAKKYLNYLRSTLYYGSWARNWLERLGDEVYTEQQYGSMRRHRTMQVNHLIAADKSIMLAELVQQDSTNQLAMDYLLAYDLLTLKYERLLDHLQWGQRLGYYAPMAPRAVQECIMGSWVLFHPDAKELPIPISPEVYESTGSLMQTIVKTQSFDDPSFNVPPFSQSYWHYRIVVLHHQNSMKP